MKGSFEVRAVICGSLRSRQAAIDFASLSKAFGMQRRAIIPFHGNADSEEGSTRYLVAEHKDSTTGTIVPLARIDAWRFRRARTCELQGDVSRYMCWL